MTHLAGLRLWPPWPGEPLSTTKRLSKDQKIQEIHRAAKIEIVAKLDALGDQEAGERITKDIIQAHDQLKVIFTINDPSGLGAYAALQNAGREKDIKIIAFDGQREGKLAIRDGKIYADPIQYPDKMGVKTAQVIAAYFRGEDIEPKILIPTTLYKKADADNDLDLK